MVSAASSGPLLRAPRPVIHQHMGKLARLTQVWLRPFLLLLPDRHLWEEFLRLGQKCLHAAHEERCQVRLPCPRGVPYPLLPSQRWSQKRPALGPVPCCHRVKTGRGLTAPSPAGTLIPVCPDFPVGSSSWIKSPICCSSLGSCWWLEVLVRVKTRVYGVSGAPWGAGSGVLGRTALTAGLSHRRPVLLLFLRSYQGAGERVREPRPQLLLAAHYGE